MASNIVATEPSSALTPAQKDKWRANIGVAAENFGQKVNVLTSTGIPSLISYNITGVTYNAVSDKVIATTSLAGTIAKGVANTSGGIDWATSTTTTSTAWTGCESSPAVTIVYSTASTTYNYSTDGGATWLSGTFAANPRAVSYGNGYFIAMLSDSNYYTSTDGVSWTNQGVVGTGLTISNVSFLRYMPSEGHWYVGITTSSGGDTYRLVTNTSAGVPINPFGESISNPSYSYVGLYPYENTGIAALRSNNGANYGADYQNISNTSTIANLQRTVTAFAQDDTGLRTLFVNNSTSLPHFYSDNSLFLSDIKNEAGLCVCYAGGSFKQFVIGCANGRFQHTQRGA